MKRLIILLSFALAACQLEVPNADWYRDKGDLGARKTNTITGIGEDVSKEEWDNIRFGMFCTSETNFGNYQKFIEDACATTKNCVVKDVKKALQTIEKNLNGPQ